MINTLFVAMLLGAGSGAFALFLDSCMNEGMILNWWYKMLDSIKSESLKYWFKPLGLCIYCMSEWVFIIVAKLTLPLFCWPNINYSILVFVFGSGFNYLIVDLWQKKIS